MSTTSSFGFQTQHSPKFTTGWWPVFFCLGSIVNNLIAKTENIFMVTNSSYNAFRELHLRIGGKLLFNVRSVVFIIIYH